jgi:capsular exopolysaccharide synthesis family protein
MRIRHEIADIKNLFISQVKNLVRKTAGPKKTVQYEEPRKENKENNISNYFMSQLIDAYLWRFSVEPIEETRLANISFEGRYPKLITQIINTHAKAYIEQNFKLKYETNKVAAEWLGKALEGLKKKAGESEITLQKFKEKEDIVSLDSIMFSQNADQDNIIVQKISQINASLTTAKLRRIELGTVYEQLKKVMGNPEEIEAFPDVIQDPTIRSLKNDYTALIRQYLELSERYGSKHPKMVSLESQIEEQKQRMKLEIEKLSKSIETQYKAAKENEEKLEKELNEYKREAQHLNRKALEYTVLKRDTESDRGLYDFIESKLKQTSLTQGFEGSNIFIVDYAEVPSTPVGGPKKTRFILLSAFLGLTIGVGLTFLFEYLDNTIKGPYDVEVYLRRLPFLGPIGSFSTLESELITLINPESNSSEAFRNIRTNLLLNFSSNGHNAFLITSPERGEGKTLVAANLSITMTQNRQKVLLIDANMRMPRLYSLFGVENSSGLSEVLKGEEDVDTIIKPTEIENISIITAGKIPLDPSELLGSEAMVKIVEEMKKKFDFVIIDAPGISVGPDSAVISRLVDGVVILTQFGKTPRTIAQQAIDQLLNIQAKLSGVVINNVDYERGRYHYPYYGRLLKADSQIDMYMVERRVS